MSSNTATPVRYFDSNSPETATARQKLERSLAAINGVPLDPVTSHATVETPSVLDTTEDLWQNPVFNGPAMYQEAQRTNLLPFTGKCVAQNNHALENIAKWLFGMQSSRNNTVQLDVMGLRVDLKVASVELQEESDLLILGIENTSSAILHINPGTVLKITTSPNGQPKQVTYFGDLKVSRDFPYYFMVFLTEKNTA